MKKWKIVFLISLVLTVIFMILCGILNAESTRGMWQVMKALCFIAFLIDIIAIIGSIVTSITNKEKMPIWLIIIIAIAIAIGAMFLIGQMEQDSYNEKVKENVNQITKELMHSTNNY